MESGRSVVLTSRQRAGVAAVVTGSVAWFVVAWAVRHKSLVEAVAETCGATTAFLLALSIGAVAVRTRRPPPPP